MDFGAKGDGITDDTAAIKNAINAAISSGKALYVPATKFAYMYLARELYFNFANISENRCLMIYGDGESSCFKLIDGQINQNWCQSFRFAPVAGVAVTSIYIADIKVDNNARGSTPPPIENPYAYEQSATFALGAVAGSTIDSVTYDNVIVVDPAADSFNNSSRGKIGELRYLNVIERGRTRVRASIQESFSSLKTIISNPLVHSIESEAGVAPTNGRATVQIDGGQVSILDIGASNENDDVTYRINNLIVTDFCNIGVLKDLEVNGGQLPISANQSNFPYLTKAIFRNLKILHPYDPVTGAVTSLYFLRRATSDAKSYVEFDNVTFEIKHEGSLPVAATNPLITNSLGSAIAEAVAANHELVIKNSRFDKRAYQSIAAHRMGKVELINNKYAGAYAAISWSTAGSGYATDLRIDGGDFNDVTGDALVFSGVVTPAHKLKLAGRWQGLAASKVKLLSGTMAVFAVNISNSRILELNTALPTIALTNDVFIKSSASNTVGDVVEYQCVVGSVTAPAFVCKNQLGMYAAATADLPILTQNEQLARAHDTTTNTIKTWTGASWV